MPRLHWDGKEAVVNYDKRVPIHLLDEVPELAVPGDAGKPTHTLIEGDNLLALKALMPRYKGRVKCVYIDPPYNTGNQTWIYNDNVNNPLQRRFASWIGQEVGKDDLCRHDKWLCFIYPRLTLLRDLLKTDGVIFVSIDETEYSHLLLVMDEIFGADNRVGTVVWKNVTDNNPTNIVPEHEYILCYARDRLSLSAEWKSSDLAVKRRLLDIGKEFIAAHADANELQKAYSAWFRENKEELWPFQDYKFIDRGGIYTGLRGVHNPGKDGYKYDVLHPTTGRPCKLPLMGYRFPQESMARLLAEKRIIFGEDESKIIELKVYAKDYRAKMSSVVELDGRIGTNEIKNIFPESKRPFDFPKPSLLIEELLSFVTSQEDIILDAFAGSGSTGQAVMRLNAGDDGKRECLLIQLGQDQAAGPNIARAITHQRISRTSMGYTNAKNEPVSGLKQSWRHYVIGQRFIAPNEPPAAIPFDRLAPIVYWHATGEALPASGRRSAYLGTSTTGTAVVLLYNGDMEDKDPRGENALNRGTWKLIKRHVEAARRTVVFCTGIAGVGGLIDEFELRIEQMPQCLERIGE